MHVKLCACTYAQHVLVYVAVIRENHSWIESFIKYRVLCSCTQTPATVITRLSLLQRHILWILLDNCTHTCNAPARSLRIPRIHGSCYETLDPLALLCVVLSVWSSASIRRCAWWTLRIIRCVIETWIHGVFWSWSWSPLWLTWARNPERGKWRRLLRSASSMVSDGRCDRLSCLCLSA